MPVSVPPLYELCIDALSRRVQERSLQKQLQSLRSQSSPSPSSASTSAVSAEQYKKLFLRVLAKHRANVQTYSPVEYWLLLWRLSGSNRLDLSKTNATFHHRFLNNERFLQLFAAVKYLDLGHSQVGSDGIKYVCRYMPSLGLVMLTSCENVRDADIACLASLPQVRLTFYSRQRVSLYILVYILFGAEAIG